MSGTRIIPSSARKLNLGKNKKRIDRTPSTCYNKYIKGKQKEIKNYEEHYQEHHQEVQPFRR
jgi:hypothetical protein